MTTDTDVEELEAGLVPVGEKTRDVHHYTTTGQVVTLGQIISRNYKGEQAQRHYFHSAKGEEGKPKTYRLGVSTHQFKFVDHTVALDPLINRGYTIKDTVISRGGIHMYSVLERPDAVPINDPIDWDLQYWHGQSGSGLQRVARELRESVVVFSAIRPGKGIKYHRGWFRMICSNGLVAELLRLGSAKLNHANWSGPSILNGLKLSEAFGEVQVGPYVGSQRGVTRLARLIESLITLPETEAETTDPEDGTVSASVEELIRDLPLFIQDEVRPFLAMPIWFRQALADQFYTMAANIRETQKVSALDVINAVTNPINLERFHAAEPHSVLRPLTRTNVLTTSASKLIGAFSL